MPRRLLAEHVRILFSQTRDSWYWKRVKQLPIILRYIVWIFLMLFGILGIFTPIPAWIVFFVIGLALCIGLRRARAWTLNFIHLTRLHILYGKIYVWWQMRKR